MSPLRDPNLPRTPMRRRASVGATGAAGTEAPPTTGVDHSTVSGAWVVLGMALLGAAVSVALVHAK